MKIIGITRVRNEAKIIQNTLFHVSKLVDCIVVYDDASTDDTVKICNDHHAVTKVIAGKIWNPTPVGRSFAEGILRQMAYNEAVRQGADWIYCFDADEYADFDMVDFNSNVETYYFRLFDFYITKEDVYKSYLDRKYMGGEFRDIPMLFKVNDRIEFKARIPYFHGLNMAMGGYVKHYGKAISVEEWDKTCEYYINHRWKNTDPVLLKRWENRVGKAIHTKSDFNTELITWDQRTDVSKINKIG